MMYSNGFVLSHRATSAPLLQFRAWYSMFCSKAIESEMGMVEGEQATEKMQGSSMKLCSDNEMLDL